MKPFIRHGATSIRWFVLLGMHAATAAEKAPVPEATSEAMLMERLVQLYREFALPLPPADAPLVRCPTGWSRQAASGEMQPVFTLGFLLQPARGETTPELLIGAVRSQKE